MEGSDASDDDSVPQIRQQQRRRIEDPAIDRRILAAAANRAAADNGHVADAAIGAADNGHVANAAIGAAAIGAAANGRVPNAANGAAVNGRVENPDAVMDPAEEAWLERIGSLTFESMKLNCSQSSVYRYKTQLLPEPLVDSDPDDSDDDDQVAPTLSNVSHVASLGTNYENQEHTYLVGIIASVKMTSSVPITAYSRGGNQQNRGRNQQMNGVQRMATCVDPEGAAGNNVFVVIEQRSNGILFANDIVSRDEGQIRK